MTTLRPAPVDARQFAYDAPTKTFVGEVSNTRGLGRVYNDATTKGLTVVGVTGREVVFVAHAVRLDREGDVQRWELHSTCGEYRMVLFND